MSEQKDTQLSILGLSLSDLKATLSAEGLKPYVARQIYDWVFARLVGDFDDMTNISKANREQLSQLFTVSPFVSHTTLPSSEGNAIKYIFRLNGGQAIESVVLKEKTYNTLCVSSQSGCPVDCKFCLTGVAGFNRNLTVAEIVGQVWQANQDGHTISRLVFMGMGEPMLNYDNLFAAIDLLNSEEGFNISSRKITVSTSGFKKNIQRLIDDKRFINLAYSVGCADPIKRAKYMPLEVRNPITEVARLLKQYLAMHNRKLTLEYTLLAGENDKPLDIESLINLAKYLNAKVNLINLNPHPKIPFKPVIESKLLQIKSHIAAGGVPVTVRYKKGQDITAACGQLGESILK